MQPSVTSTNDQIVNADDLEFEDDGTLCLYRGQPFSGLAHEFFPNGGIATQSRFVGGRRQGITRQWYDAGQLQSEGEFLGEGVHGVKREWYPNGQLKRESRCEHGVPLGIKAWDEGGRLVEDFRLSPSDALHETLVLMREIWAAPDER